MAIVDSLSKVINDLGGDSTGVNTIEEGIDTLGPLLSGGGGGGGIGLSTGAIILDGNNFSVEVDTGTSSSFESYIEEMDPISGPVPPINESVLFDITAITGDKSTRYKSIGHHTINRGNLTNVFTENILITMVSFSSDTGATDRSFYGIKRTYDLGEIGEWTLYLYAPDSTT